VLDQPAFDGAVGRTAEHASDGDILLKSKIKPARRGTDEGRRARQSLQTPRVLAASDVRALFPRATRRLPRKPPAATSVAAKLLRSLAARRGPPAGRRWRRTRGRSPFRHRRSPSGEVGRALDEMLDLWRDAPYACLADQIARASGARGAAANRSRSNGTRSPQAGSREPTLLATVRDRAR
jgi:hypothetical protein